MTSSIHLCHSPLWGLAKSPSHPEPQFLICSTKMHGPKCQYVDQPSQSHLCMGTCEHTEANPNPWVEQTPGPRAWNLHWLLNGLRSRDRTQSLGKRPSQLPDQHSHLHDSIEWVLENLSHFLSRPTGTGPSYGGKCP